jgi:hypothetical protein
MSALTTHLFGNQREKKKRKETTKETQTSNRKPKKAKSKIT